MRAQTLLGIVSAIAASDKSGYSASLFPDLSGVPVRKNSSTAESVARANEEKAKHDDRIAAAEAKRQRKAEKLRRQQGKA